MALWKDNSAVRKESMPRVGSSTAVAEPVERGDARSDATSDTSAARAASHSGGSEKFAPSRDRSETRESLIAREIVVEGKIEGAGHVRIAGRFKGEVQVKGTVSIETGAKVTGGVHADTVTIGGDVDGNIESVSLVELLETGVLNGDLKAASLTVAAGSRMRGQVEFGWDDHSTGSKSATKAAAVAT